MPGQTEPAEGLLQQLDEATAAIGQRGQRSSAPGSRSFAHHFALAAVGGKAARAVEYAARAGDEALGRLAYEAAAEQYRVAIELVGYSRDERLRLSPADLVVADFELVPPPKIDQYVVGKTITREHHVRRGDGSIILVEVSSRLLPDGRVQPIIRDISERRRADQALRESEARLQLALIAAQLATWDLDVRSGAALLSPRLLEWMQTPDPASCNTIADLMRSVHRDDRPAIERKFNAALALGSGEFSFEYRTNPKRGAVLCSSTRASLAQQGAAGDTPGPSGRRPYASNGPTTAPPEEGNIHGAASSGPSPSTSCRY